MKHRTEEEYQAIARNMMSYGGSFFSLLGEAILAADDVNKQKLANCFARDFARYQRFTGQ